MSEGGQAWCFCRTLLVLIATVCVANSSLCLPSYTIRDWSLITGRRGATKWEGGHVKFYPYEKGGGQKGFSHVEGGTQKVSG